MRKTLVAAAVATVFSAGAFLTGGASAMTLTAPSGLRAATEGVTPAEQVRYVCYRNSRGVRVCSYRRNYGYYGGSPYYSGYYPSYGYYGSPYYYGPSVGVGLGYYGWGGGWGGNRTVIHRRTVVRRGHR
jgi:hypothetical protein